MRILSKVTISVLVIWVAIGVSLATLYPLTETIEDQQTNIGPNIGPGNLQPGTDTGNTQKTQKDTGSGNLQTNSGFDDSQNDDSGDTQSGNDEPGNDKPGNDEPGTGSGNKYLVNNFVLDIAEFTAEITNPKDRVKVDGFYEIKKRNSAANHKDVLQSGYFPYSTGTFAINFDVTEFVPEDNTKYYILVYTNYPEQSNRVDKDNYTYNP